MPIRIFDVDPDAKPKPRGRLDVVGRFRSGTQLNNRPVALDQWRVTTGDPDVADAIADLYGGTPEEWKETKTEEKIEVFTEQEAVNVIIEKGKVLSELGLWNRANKKIRTCDGVTQSAPNDGQPCVCPQTFDERKKAEQDGVGCSPQVTIFFRLVDNPDLGLFKFQSQAWGLVRSLPAFEDELDKVYAESNFAVVRMELEKIEFDSKSTGQHRKYTASKFTVLSAWEDSED